MASKKALSDALNDFLGLDERIAFENLTRRDLERLIDIFDNPKELIRRLVKEEAADRIKARSKDLVDLVEEGLREGLRDVPRPFGILDKILRGERKGRS
ncbi:MAG: hypothetical protein JRD89_20820 [Deltaproteobacteria bacterium]|nr:hypothetical protein [Deltaproteobacteria bacterium]